ncbi:MAG TPA: helix-turn-helix transcriptional regulator [Devosia sp.]|nr:helix-turn-helix transcriptional regulator [Devosia sp.]
MLTLFERYIERIRLIRTEADALPVMRDIADEFGYRQATVVEYQKSPPAMHLMLDTHGGRVEWYEKHHLRSLYNVPQDVLQRYETEPVVLLDRSRLTGRPAQEIAMMEDLDLIDVTVVPVRDDHALIGTVAYSGIVELIPSRSTALQIISINLFVQLRALKNLGFRPRHGALTAREKQVMALSAEGLTSAQIAEKLGMSPRTVNQHVDNVADKLGTRNRTHTIAEVIRHGLLD